MKKINLLLCLVALTVCAAWGAMMFPGSGGHGGSLSGSAQKVEKAHGFAGDGAVARAAGGRAASLPYTYNFSESGIGDWQAFDANGDGITWTESSFGRNFGICCREGSTGLGEDDDYLVSGGTFSLEAGKEYVVTLTIGGFCTDTGTNAISVVVGSGDDFTSYSDVGSFALQQQADVPVRFTASGSGDFRIGIHNACVKSVWYVTAISIAEAGGGTTPTYGPGVMLDADFTLGESVMDYGWTVIDGNGDGNTWGFQSGMDGIALTRSTASAQDDWLVSHAMTLAGGKAYAVEYTLSASGGFEPELVTTAYGTTPDASGLTAIVGGESLQGGEITRHYRFIPAADGTYYFGFHATSPARNGTIQIKNVTIKESEGCIPLAPAGVTAQPDIKRQEVALAWTNPVLDTEGVAIQGNVTTRIVRNGATVADVAGGAPGAEMEYVDRPEPFAGEAKYEVYSYVEDGKLSEPAEAVANLDDFQGDRKVLQTWGGTYGGGFNSDWTAVNVSGNNKWTTVLYNDSWQINYGKLCDNWLISPEIAMSANRRYVVEIEAKTGINYPADFEVYLGKGPNVGDMTRQVYSFSAEGNGTIAYTSEQFTVDEDGGYYMGVRATDVTTQTSLLKYTIYYYENSESAPEDIPYTESFDGTRLEGWSLGGESSFALADGALASSGTGGGREETVYSPLVNLKAGYTYEVSFDYTNGCADGSGFAFYMANGQSEAELIAGSRTELARGNGSARYLFTPQSDGTYCAAWKLSAAAGDEGTVSIGNVGIGVDVYSSLPYSENFEDCRINAVPAGYSGMTTVSEADGNIVAEVAPAGGMTLWLMPDGMRDTYHLSLKAKTAGGARWTVCAVSLDGSRREVGQISGGDGAYKALDFDILSAGTERPDTFRIEFAASGSGSLLIDDVNVTVNARAVVPGAPYNFRVYKDGIAALCFPKTETDGYLLEASARVDVTLYDGDKELLTLTGAPGEYMSVMDVEFDGEWTNDTKLFRAVSSVGGTKGGTATWVLRKNDSDMFKYDGNINMIADFDFSDDEKWTGEGWTFAAGNATAGPAPATMTSPEVELEAGRLYLIRYYIDTDADAGADFSVTVGDYSQDFAGAYIGRNTFDWNVGPDHPDYPVGRYQYIDFLLPRIENAGAYDVTVAAERVGSSLSVGSVQVFEVREYPSVCTIPYENGFDDPAVPENTVEPNWNIPMYTNPWRIADAAGYGFEALSGSRALIAPPTTELGAVSPMDFVYTPYFSFEEGKTYKVEFDYYMPSDGTGLAFVYANEPSYEAYSTIEELSRTDEWRHYSKELDVYASGNSMFGFVSYATGAREGVTAIDNFKVSEVAGSSSIGSVGAADGLSVNGGTLNVPAGTKGVDVYDVRGCLVLSAYGDGAVSLDMLPRGIYVVKAVRGDGTVATLKFLR